MSAASPAEVIDTVAKAAAYGDYDKLREFVEADADSVNAPDAQGYHPLQWAALNNRVAEATYLYQNGAHVNAQDSTGQTALHWAAVRGSLAVLETLLRNGADPLLADNRGYTVCHVAAQYGQTAVLYHLALKWNVDCDAPDTDGRTPLHWAAYKGFPDTIRLLLVLDARYTLPDKEGCTPLHWAAIKGNGEACTVLIQGGALPLLTARDVTGSTPAQLAVEKGHRYLGLHLQEIYNASIHPLFGKHGRLAFMKQLQLCPIIWALIIGLVSVFVFRVVGHQHMLALSASSSSSSKAPHGKSLLQQQQQMVGSMPASLQQRRQHHRLKTQPDVTTPAAAAAGGASTHSTATSSSSNVTGAVQSAVQLAVSAAALSGQLAAAANSSAGALSGLSSGITSAALGGAMGHGNSSSTAQQQALSSIVLLLAWTVVVAASVGLVFLHRTTVSDPGFLATATSKSSSRKREPRDLKAAAAVAAGGGGGGAGTASLSITVGGQQGGAGAGGGYAGTGALLSRQDSKTGSTADARGLLDCPALAAGQWQQLCVTCKIVRPLRAKHCSVTERCVEVFDHYCPWVGNCIGKGNRHLFLVFLCLELYALLVSLGVAVAQLQLVLSGGVAGVNQLVWVMMFLVLDAFVSISVSVLAVAQAAQVARNVTTNELANWHRYKYLQDGGGRFSNPFNRGLRVNCWEAFHPDKVPPAPMFLQRDASSGGVLSAAAANRQGCCHHHHHHQHSGYHRCSED